MKAETIRQSLYLNAVLTAWVGAWVQEIERVTRVKLLTPVGKVFDSAT